MNDNPFDRFDVDPSSGPEAITEALREKMEDAKSDDERARLREAWEAMTRDPMLRLVHALAAHPESRLPLGHPPPGVRGEGVPQPPRAIGEVTLLDILPLPSMSDAWELRERATPEVSNAPEPWWADALLKPRLKPDLKPE
jgi:hypothetical protein